MQKKERLRIRTFRTRNQAINWKIGCILLISPQSVKENVVDFKIISFVN